VLRPLFRSVARTHSVELFVAACLLVVIVVGLATAAAGLSMALGALIGGLLLAGTEYRRQVEVTIEPFKGLAVGVFLISVGMSLDTRTLGTWPFLVSTAIACVVLLKLLVVTGLARAFGLNWAQGLHTGLLLGPGGEFAFVIVSVASGEHLLASDTAQDCYSSPPSPWRPSRCCRGSAPDSCLAWRPKCRLIQAFWCLRFLMRCPG